MTPGNIVSTIRDQFYETSPGFITEAELYLYIWQAEAEIAALIECTEATDSSTTTVASTQEYSKPSDCLLIKRVTWYDKKLKRINLVDQDAMDDSGYGSSVSTGNPDSYYEYGDVVGLYPIPSSAQTLKFWYIQQPTVKTSSSTSFDVPTMFEHYIPDYCLYRVYLKDQDDARASIHKRLWDENIVKGAAKWARRDMLDGHYVVKMEGAYPMTDLGMA